MDPPPIINLGFVSEREDYPFSGLLSVFFQWRRWRWVFRCRFSRCSLGTSGFCSLFGGEAVMTTTVPLLRTCDTILTTSPPLTKSNVQEINALRHIRENGFIYLLFIYLFRSHQVSGGNFETRMTCSLSQVHSLNKIEHRAAKNFYQTPLRPTTYISKLWKTS